MSSRLQLAFTSHTGSKVWVKSGGRGRRGAGGPSRGVPTGRGVACSVHGDCTHWDIISSILFFSDSPWSLQARQVPCCMLSEHPVPLL